MTSAAEARQGLADLTSVAAGDLEALYGLTDEWRAEDLRDALMEVLPMLGAEYGDAAVSLAMDFYETAREAADADGSFSPIAPDAPGRARWEALARWGVGPLFGASPDLSASLALVGGGLQRAIADQHRLTIVESSIADPKASGWRRVGVGHNCDFCRMLIARGHVYTEKSVTFRSHDNCNCAASPSFAPNVIKVSGEPFRQSKRNRSDAQKRADNERAREYIANNL